MKKLEKKYEVFEFIRYPFDLEDNFKDVNLYEPKYMNMYFNWKEAIKVIDKRIGRNTLFAILKYEAIIGWDNKPIIKKRANDIFRAFTSNEMRSWPGYYYGKGNIFITGKGLLEIRRKLFFKRIAGGNY